MEILLTVFNSKATLKVPITYKYKANMVGYLL